MKQRRRLSRSLLHSSKAAGIAAVLSCAAIPATATSAPSLARRSFTVTDFDTIRLEAPVEAMLVSGRGVSVAATGDRSDLDALDIATNGRVLTIRMHSDPWRRPDGKRQPTRITLTAGDIKRADVAGAGSLTLDRLKGARTSANVSGSGSMTVGGLTSDRIDINLLGAGTLAIAGTVPDAQIVASGSGRLDAAKLIAVRLRVTAEGAVDGKFLAKGSAFVDANGAAHIAVVGPAKCTVNRAGSAGVTCGGQDY